MGDQVINYLITSWLHKPAIPVIGLIVYMQIYHVGKETNMID